MGTPIERLIYYFLTIIYKNNIANTSSPFQDSEKS